MALSNVLRDMAISLKNGKCGKGKKLMYPNNDFEKLDLFYRFFAWSQVLDETNETKETLGFDNCDTFRDAMATKIHNLEKVVLKSICERLKSKIKRDVVECLDGENDGKGSYDILFKDIPNIDLDTLKGL